MASTLQLLTHLLIYAFGVYLLYTAFRTKLRTPADCLQERRLVLMSEDLLEEAEFRIMMNKAMKPKELNRFFSIFAQYFKGLET